MSMIRKIFQLRIMDKNLNNSLSTVDATFWRYQNFRRLTLYISGQYESVFKNYK